MQLMQYLLIPTNFDILDSLDAGWMASHPLGLDEEDGAVMWDLSEDCQDSQEPIQVRLEVLTGEASLVRLVLLCPGLHQERAEQQAEELEEPAEARAEVAEETAQELAEEPAPPAHEPGDSGVLGEDSATDVPGSHLLCAVQVPSTVLHVVLTAVEQGQQGHLDHVLLPVMPA